MTLSAAELRHILQGMCVSLSCKSLIEDIDDSGAMQPAYAVEPGPEQAMASSKAVGRSESLLRSGEAQLSWTVSLGCCRFQSVARWLVAGSYDFDTLLLRLSFFAGVLLNRMYDIVPVSMLAGGRHYA